MIQLAGLVNRAPLTCFVRPTAPRQVSALRQLPLCSVAACVEPQGKGQEGGGPIEVSNSKLGCGGCHMANGMHCQVRLIVAAPPPAHPDCGLLLTAFGRRRHFPPQWNLRASLQLLAPCHPSSNLLAAESLLLLAAPTNRTAPHHWGTPSPSVDPCLRLPMGEPPRLSQPLSSSFL
jgi:hypothetical protein